jgi:hypothetical protein
VLRGQNNLTPPFAKLGRDKLKAERLVNVFFTRRRYELFAAIKSIAFKLKAFLVGEFTHLLQMRWRNPSH